MELNSLVMVVSGLAIGVCLYVWYAMARPAAKEDFCEHMIENMEIRDGRKYSEQEHSELKAEMMHVYARGVHHAS